MCYNNAALNRESKVCYMPVELLVFCMCLKQAHVAHVAGG